MGWCLEFRPALLIRPSFVWLAILSSFRPRGAILAKELARDLSEVKVSSIPDHNPRANIRALDYVAYRGGAGMIAWFLHRVTGLGVLVFVFAHVLDTALIGWGPHAYNKAIHLYRLTGFRIGEILLVGAVLYHALNGLRITIMDFWPQTTVIQKKLSAAAIVLFVVLYLPAVFWMAKGIMK